MEESLARGGKRECCPGLRGCRDENLESTGEDFEPDRSFAQGFAVGIEAASGF
jgi:hypothetical protein